MVGPTQSKIPKKEKKEKKEVLHPSGLSYESLPKLNNFVTFFVTQYCFSDSHSSLIGDYIIKSKKNTCIFL